MECLNIWLCTLLPRITESQDSSSSPKQKFFLQYPKQTASAWPHSMTMSCVRDITISKRKEGLGTGLWQELPATHLKDVLCSGSRQLHFPIHAGGPEDLPVRCCLYIRHGAKMEGAPAVVSANRAVWAKQTTEGQRREQAMLLPIPRKMLPVRKCHGGKVTASHLCPLILKGDVTATGANCGLP